VEGESKESPKRGGDERAEKASSAYPKQQQGKGGNFRQVRNEMKQRQQLQNQNHRQESNRDIERKSEHGNHGAVDVQQQPSARNIDSGERREREKVSDRGDAGAVDVSNRGGRAGTDRRARRLEKGADQRSREAAVPDIRSPQDSCTMIADATIVDPPRLIFEVSDGPEIHDDLEAQQQQGRGAGRVHKSGGKGVASDGGESQPVNFRAGPRISLDPSEDSDDYSEDEDELPGAFNITTAGIVSRHKGQLTESGRGSSVYSSKTAQSKESKESSKVYSGNIISDLTAQEEPALVPATKIPETEEVPSRRPLLLKVGGCCLLIVIAVAVSIPFVLPDKPEPVTSEAPTVAPTGTITPTMAPTFNERTIDFISILGNVSDTSALLNETMPQSKAVVWLADEEGFKVGRDKLDAFDSDHYDIILERYVMALLYFSSVPQNSTLNIDVPGFLSGGSVCGWNNNIVDGSGSMGVFCDDSIHVSEVKLSKFRKDLWHFEFPHILLICFVLQTGSSSKALSRAKFFLFHCCTHCC
jgi:hypothetical protein